MTYVSEKSGVLALNDSASTKALAGSILSYRQNNEPSASEDGTSERVRFDNTVCYVIDGKKDNCEIWYTAPLDQVRLNEMLLFFILLFLIFLL